MLEHVFPAARRPRFLPGAGAPRVPGGAAARDLEWGRAVGPRRPAPSRLLVLSIVAAVALLLSSTRAGAEAPGPAPVEITVHSGDTLWGIVTARYGGARDPRESVAEIVALNGLESTVIRPGDRLLVPR